MQCFHIVLDKLLSNFIDLSNAYSLFGQCTQHINFQKVFGGVRKMNGH